MKLRVVCMAMTLVFPTANAAAQDACPYLPAFTSLRKQIDVMPAPAAVVALQKYVLAHENPEGCELVEIDRLLAEREAGLVRLVLAKRQIPAQAIFRCNVLDPLTTQCQSPMEDGTAHPARAGVRPMPRPERGATYQVRAQLPAARLLGLYRTSMSDALDGKAARPTGKGAGGKWPLARKPTALIAIYKTPGPWRYRKAVWYFE